MPAWKNAIEAKLSTDPQEFIPIFCSNIRFVLKNQITQFLRTRLENAGAKWCKAAQSSFF